MRYDAPPFSETPRAQTTNQRPCRERPPRVQSELGARVSGPVGAGVTNGVFGWIPSEAQGPGTNVVKVSVSDGSLSATNVFTVVVKASEVVVPVLRISSVADTGNLELQILGAEGAECILETSTNLADWTEDCRVVAGGKDVPVSVEREPMLGPGGPFWRVKAP